MDLVGVGGAVTCRTSDSEAGGKASLELARKLGGICSKHGGATNSATAVTRSNRAEDASSMLSG